MAATRTPRAPGAPGARCGLPRGPGAAGAVAGAGLALLAYYGSVIERQAYTLRELRVPALARGAPALRILHLSDVHMLARQRDKQNWIRGLARLDPDLVVDTGDNLAGPDGVAGMLRALEPLLDRPGVFVFGANDYYAPRPVRPAGARRRPRRRGAGADLPSSGLAAELTGAGWVDLRNCAVQLTVGGLAVSLIGVDDPHLGRDHLPEHDPRWAGADLRIGVVHAPEPRVLDQLVLGGADLLLAGHTHGGQVRLPGVGALVTNCGLDRGRARGLSSYPVGSARAWLHVSAGLGTSPYAPVRLACPPEATLLSVVADPDRSGHPQRAG